MERRSRSLNTEIIILGHKNIGEADKLLFVYSKEFGKKKLIAKGSRKIKSKFLGHIESLNHGIAQIYMGPRNTLITEIIPISCPKSIRQDLSKLSAALLIAEITEQTLYEDQIIDGLFDLLKNSIQHLEKSNKPFLISISYSIKLLDLLGLSPNFQKIKSKVETRYLNFFEYIRTQNFTSILKINLTDKDIHYIKDFIKRIVEHNTDRQFKSLHFDI